MCWAEKIPWKEACGLDLAAARTCSVDLLRLTSFLSIWFVMNRQAASWFHLANHGKTVDSHACASVCVHIQLDGLGGPLRVSRLALRQQRQAI